MSVLCRERGRQTTGRYRKTQKTEVDKKRQKNNPEERLLLDEEQRLSMDTCG